MTDQDPGPSPNKGRVRDERFRQRDALMELTANPLLAADEMPVALRLITETAAATLHVARASIWRYDDDRTVIRCADLYEAARREHTDGAVLRAADYPSYFRALAASDVIAAHDAHRDSRTREFSASYLTPLAIVAMLDASIRVGPRVTGVLCHEHVGVPRRWTADEQTMAVSLANLVSLVLERWERQQAERQFRAVVEAAANAFVLGDDQGRIVLVNSEAERVFGRLRESLVGQSLDVLVPERFRGQHSAQYARFMAASDTRALGVGRELVGLRANGVEVPVEIGLSPMTIGSRRFVLASLVDVTERKRSERLRFSIGHTLSHELNTPLNGILGALEVLRDTTPAPSPEVAQGMLDILATSALRLHILVQRNLDFAQLELLGSEHFPIETPPTPRDAGALVRDLAGRIAQEHQRGADLALDVSAGAVSISDRWLVRLVTELLENAFKFSLLGSPVRLATRAGESFELIVEDSGRGMVSEEIGAIGAFVQFDRRRYEQQGVGLGLYLASRIAELHGGSLKVQSRHGTGTTVTVALRLPPTDPSDADRKH